MAIPCRAGRHQPFDFLAGNGDVADQFPHDGADEVAKTWRYRNDGAGLADEDADFADKFAVRERFGTDGVDNGVLRTLALFDGELGEVVDEDGLDAVLPVAEHAEDRKAAEDPRDVVDEDVFFAEEDRRAEDGVGQTRFPEGAFEHSLALEVLQREIFGGIRDAHVNDAPHAGLFGGLEERQRILDGGGVFEVRVIKPDPVGVVEDIRARQ